MQGEFGFKACIKKNFGALKSKVKMSTVADFLIERGVLELAEWEHLESMEIDEDERTKMFLLDLCEKTENEFQIFIEALRTNGHEVMASQLEVTYIHKSKKRAEEEDLSNRLEVLHTKGIQAQTPIDTTQRRKSSKGEETKMVAILQSMRHDQEKMMKKMMEAQKKMTEEQERMAGVMETMDTKLQKGREEQTKMASTIDTMSTKLENMEQEMEILRTDIQMKGAEHRKLAKENKRLNSTIEKQNKEIDDVYIQLEQLLKSQECDQAKNDELAQKYKDLLKSKQKIDSEHQKIVEKVSSFEMKFSELMGKRISFENSLAQLEINLRREQRNKTSLMRELEEKTQTSQHVAQLRVEIEKLRTQEQEMKKYKEEMAMKIQNLTKAKKNLKFQYDILYVKYNREKDKVVTFKKY